MAGAVGAAVGAPAAPAVGAAVDVSELAAGVEEAALDGVLVTTRNEVLRREVSRGHQRRGAKPARPSLVARARYLTSWSTNSE